MARKAPTVTPGKTVVTNEAPIMEAVEEAFAAIDISNLNDAARATFEGIRLKFNGYMKQGCKESDAILAILAEVIAFLRR